MNHINHWKNQKFRRWKKIENIYLKKEKPTKAIWFKFYYLNSDQADLSKRNQENCWNYIVSK